MTLSLSRESANANGAAWHGRVLLADDDAVGLGRARLLLRALGFTVDVAHDGKQAIARLRSAPAKTFRMVITDFHMPEADGGDVIRFMRRSKRWERTPIILFSATVAETEVLDLCGLPLVSFLSKPASKEILDRAIGMALETAASAS